MVRGLEFYIRILAMCPTTNAEISEQFGCGKKDASDLTRELVKVGLIRCDGYAGGKGNPHVYARGGKWTPMAEPPTESAYKLMAMLRVLQTPKTTKEFADEMGVARETAGAWASLLKRHGIVHICEWEISGVTRVPVYVAGEGKDARRPKAMKRLQVNKRYREAQKAKWLDSAVRSMYAVPDLSSQA